MCLGTLLHMLTAATPSPGLMGPQAENRGWEERTTEQPKGSRRWRSTAARQTSQHRSQMGVAVKNAVLSGSALQISVSPLQRAHSWSPRPATCQVHTAPTAQEPSSLSSRCHAPGESLQNMWASVSRKLTLLLKHSYTNKYEYPGPYESCS